MKGGVQVAWICQQALDFTLLLTPHSENIQNSISNLYTISGCNKNTRLRLVEEHSTVLKTFRCNKIDLLSILRSSKIKSRILIRTRDLEV